jgi:hypothetical protein
MRHIVEDVGKMGGETRGDERLSQGYTLRWRPRAATRHLASPRRKMRLLMAARKLIITELNDIGLAAIRR